MPHHSSSTDEVINLLPSHLAIKAIPKGLVGNVGSLKVVRLVIAAGETIPEHHASGAISVFCLAGHADLQVREVTHHMEQNDLICLSQGTPHSVKAIKDSILLVNISAT